MLTVISATLLSAKSVKLAPTWFQVAVSVKMLSSQRLVTKLALPVLQTAPSVLLRPHVLNAQLIGKGLPAKNALISMSWWWMGMNPHAKRAHQTVGNANITTLLEFAVPHVKAGVLLKDLLAVIPIAQNAIHGLKFAPHVSMTKCF